LKRIVEPAAISVLLCLVLVSVLLFQVACEWRVLLWVPNLQGLNLQNKQVLV
jgi:hypothetical protein